MSWLTLNSVPVPAASTEDAHDIPRDIGSDEVAYDGTLRRTRMASKIDLEFSTPPNLSITDALAWSSMVRGLGHVWSFESSVYSSKGLGPVAGSAISQQANINSQYGGGRAQVQGLTQYSVGLDTKWTMLVWRIATAGTPWDFYCLLDTGVWYKNGVIISTPSPLWANVGSGSLNLESEFEIRSGAAWVTAHSYVNGSYVRPTTPNGLYYVSSGGTHNSGGSEPSWPLTVGATVADGSLTWTCVGLDALYIDDLVYLPFRIPVSWIASLYASTTAWGDLPRLTAAGDVIAEGSTRTVIGSVTSSKIQPANGSSTTHQLGITLKGV